MRQLTGEEIAKLSRCVLPTDNFFEIYRPGRLIGQGNLCEGVYQCESALTGEKYAVKILDRAKLKPSQARRYQEEVMFLRMMQHPNIVTME